MTTNRKGVTSAVAAQRAVGLKGDDWDNYAVAHETLLDEMYGSDSSRQPYSLTEDARDILLAHARQDAAHALANTTSLLRRVQILTKLTYLLLAIVFASTAALLLK